MKKDIHPTYGPVVFRDAAAGFAFLTRSTLAGGDSGASRHAPRTIEWEDGNTYPVIDVEVSSASHPFYTGTARVVDTAGRVEKFRRRYGVRGVGTASEPSTADEGATR
ncbi:MAG: type B 50S ribosomal protein L31 [Cellulomonadaceae bacterium]